MASQLEQIVNKKLKAMLKDGKAIGILYTPVWTGYLKTTVQAEQTAYNQGLITWGDAQTHARGKNGVGYEVPVNNQYHGWSGKVPPRRFKEKTIKWMKDHISRYT